MTLVPRAYRGGSARAGCGLIVACLCLSVAEAASPVVPQGVVGKVRVVGSSVNRRVHLVVAGTAGHPASTLVLLGTTVPEIRRLHGFVVEVIGVPGQQTGNSAPSFVVQRYRIIDIGNGSRPLVGTLVHLGGRFALRDGDRAPIPLSVSPRLVRRLNAAIGAKVWVYGKVLLSGEIKLARYGVLKERDQAASP